VDALIDHTAIEAVYRHEAGRVLATLIRLVGDFELAEEGAQDAFEAALARWPQMGLPANPRAWLVNTGRNKAIDRLRRRIVLRGKLKALGAEAAIADEPDTTPDASSSSPRKRWRSAWCGPRQRSARPPFPMRCRVATSSPSGSPARSKRAWR
jgi:RNA polymerase sigma-70 factor (ECF subfamily)